jgi:hypothetical protein
MPVNVRNSTNMTGNLNFQFPWKRALSRFTIGPNVAQRNNRVLLNDTEVQSHQNVLGGTARYNFSVKDFFSLDLSANISNQVTSYQSEAASKPQDQKYLNKTYTAETNITIFKNYQLNAEVNYLMYNSKTTGFSQAIPLVNVYVSRFLFKAQSGELRLGLVNALDKSLSVSQNATVNYLEQTTYNNLGRYFMVTFVYSLNKQLNPMGGDGRARAMRMMFQRD